MLRAFYKSGIYDLANVHNINKLSFSQCPTAMISPWMLGTNKLPHPRVRHVLRETQRREERDEHLRDGGSSSGEEFEELRSSAPRGGRK